MTNDEILVEVSRAVNKAADDTQAYCDKLRDHVNSQFDRLSKLHVDYVNFNAKNNEAALKAQKLNVRVQNACILLSANETLPVSSAVSMVLRLEQEFENYD